MERDGEDIEGGRCMKGKDGKLGFSENNVKRIQKNHMEENMNKENDKDHIIEASMVEALSSKEIVIAIKAMKPGKAAGPSEVCAEMISASG